MYTYIQTHSSFARTRATPSNLGPLPPLPPVMCHLGTLTLRASPHLISITTTR